MEQIQYRLSHDKYKYGLDASMSAKTSAWIFEQVHSHLVHLPDANSEVFSPDKFAAPATKIQNLVNGAVVLVFCHGSNGYRLTTMTWSYVLFGSSCLTRR